MFKTILLPTDGSDHANRAALIAGDLAGKYDSDLILMHVLLRGHLDEGLRHYAEIEGITPGRPLSEAIAGIPEGRFPVSMAPVNGDETEEAVLNSVAEYVLLGRSAHLGWLSVEGRRDREIVDRVLARLDLVELAGRPITHLSGGEAQRATLARALAQEAPVLLLDEPTSALDIGHTVSVLDLVDELRAERGLTVVAAMHDLDTAGRYADTLALLDGGSVAAVGPPVKRSMMMTGRSELKLRALLESRM